MISELLLQIAMTPMRVRYRWTNRNRLVTSEKLKTVLQSRIEQFARAELPAHEEIFNVGLFIVLAEEDISAFSEAINFARSEWHRQFHARYLAVLLFELIKGLSGALGRKYRVRLVEIGCDQTWIDRLNKINKKITDFGKCNSAWLEEIRAYVAAHRDPNALEQIRVMASFNSLDVLARAAELSDPIRDLISFYIDLLEHIRKRLTVGAWINAHREADKKPSGSAEAKVGAGHPAGSIAAED